MCRDNKIFYKPYLSPFGRLELWSYDNKLCLLVWQDDKSIEHKKQKILQSLHATLVQKDNSTLENLCTQLDEYFQGKRKTFETDLLFVGSDFQKAVWEALKNVSYGKTISYKHLAALSGNPKAIRASASAVKLNNFAIILPCHRIIASNGTIGGYNAGLEIKKNLLELENKSLRP